MFPFKVVIFFQVIWTIVCLLSSTVSTLENQPEAIKWHNIPEMKMTVDEIIRYQGYPVENHDVTTDDGYILTLQRIPYGRKGPSVRKPTPVFLQHGLLDSSVTWVINYPNQSLGYVLADAGYDVWLGNSRGNTYSKRHVKLSTKSAKFWDFSFEEMAKYDLPACINYILKMTNSTQIHYVGHSQGTAIGFIEFSRNKVLAKKVKRFVALAPVASVKHIKGAFKCLANLAGPVKLFVKLFGIRNFMPSSILTKYLANMICASELLDNVCAGFIFLLAGYDTSNLNKTRAAAYVSHTPAGTSVKDIFHFEQMVNSGNFQKYDYGWYSNLRRYGQFSPPKYDISTLQTPVILFSGTNDWLAPPQDVNESVRAKIKSIVYDENIDNWNHLDFVWSKNAAKLLYNKIVKMFDKL